MAGAATLQFIALYVALKHLNKSYAAIGAVAAIASQVLFLAYFPIVNGLLYLSDQYVATDTDVVMLKGVFHKGVAYLGITTFIAAFIGGALKPIIGIGYLWWWALFMIWFIAVGWKLYRLGSSSLLEASASKEAG